jgi:hypothetical protein
MSDPPSSGSFLTIGQTVQFTQERVSPNGNIVVATVIENNYVSDYGPPPDFQIDEDSHRIGLMFFHGLEPVIEYLKTNWPFQAGLQPNLIDPLTGLSGSLKSTGLKVFGDRTLSDETNYVFFVFNSNDIRNQVYQGYRS